MKLNDSGWGLSVFFGFVVVLFICIIVVGVNAYKLGLTEASHKHYFDSEVPIVKTPDITPSSSENSVPDTTVSPSNLPNAPIATAIPNKIPAVNTIEVRQEAMEAAGLYKNDYYSNMREGEEFIVSFKKLVEYNYLKKRDECTGYVKVKMLNRNILYIPFLKCDTYISKGYESEFDEK